MCLLFTFANNETIQINVLLKQNAPTFEKNYVFYLSMC